LQWMAHESIPLTDSRVYRISIGGRTGALRAKWMTSM
jgi:hypothetical protein